MTTQLKKRFPSPFEVKAPPGAQGWEEMYPYYLLFNKQRKQVEEKFWFCESMHWTMPLYPFDAFTAESALASLGQYNTRIFRVPPALGIDIRVLNGYVYLSPIPVVNPQEIEKRMSDFSKRAGFYYQNWDALYAKWKEKVTAEIGDLKKIEIPCLLEKEDFSLIKNSVGISSGYRLLEAYNHLLRSMSKIWQYHFELLNLGYVAYLDFSTFMKRMFSDISDQTITKMIAGIDIILFRPDTELKKLSKLAWKLDLKDIFIRNREPKTIIAELTKIKNGKKWLESLERAKEPWFYFNSGTGFYHTPRSWIDDLTMPFFAISGYLKKLESGENLERPQKEIKKEADRLKHKYYSLLKTDSTRKAFDEKFALVKTVYPYVEEHNFYVEHWHHTIFWNKMRELGAVFAKNNFFKNEEDIFYLNRYEISQALYELYSCWAIGSTPLGPKYWPKKIQKRKRIINALAKYQPPPALGAPPDEISEPFTIMLWGIVSEKIKAWINAHAETTPISVLKGHPASSGITQGRARVILSAEELSEIEPGEIMICPITTPSWSSVFSKLKAVVSNVGGMMSHAAIVCREYGIPAVVGTGFATQVIKTGQCVRVDGSKGIVEIIGH